MIGNLDPHVVIRKQDDLALASFITLSNYSK